MEQKDIETPEAPAPVRLYSFQRPARFDYVLENAASISLVWLGIFAFVIALELGQFFMAPIFMAVVIGLMFVPVASRLERLGWPPTVSAIVVVVALLAAIVVTMTALAIPLSTWAERLPFIWYKLTQQLASWRETLLSISEIRDMAAQFAITEEEMKLEIADAESFKSFAWSTPGMLGQFLIFLATMYFFIATRERFRAAMLGLCFSRRLRLRVARIFRDIETNVSRYLAQITLINIGLGCAVALAMWAMGMPSPLLWGVLAGVLNYIVYLGPAIMTVILLLAGLSLGGSLLNIVTPALTFLLINGIEANFLTPLVLGRTLTLNPFVVFLTLAFWIWIWGPVGGFVAVPSLLIVDAILTNVLGRDGYHPRQAA